MDTKALYFIGGVVVGFTATLIFLKRHMSRRIEEEVESVRDSFSNAKMQQNTSESVSEQSELDIDSVIEKNEQISLDDAKKAAAENAKRKADFFVNTDIINQNSYAPKTNYNLFSNPPKAKDIHNGIDEDEDLDIINTTPPDDARGPYVLEDDESSKASAKFVNEEPYFDKVTLFFYDDGILCSEDNEIITNIGETIGEESLKRIGEFEPDVVYVRNEKQSTDYEIVRQYRDFVDLSNMDD